MIEIVPRFSKAIREDPDPRVLARLERPIKVAQAVAKHISSRIKRGRFATPPQPYATRATAGPKKRPRYYISPAYAAAIGRPGETQWASSAEFHAAVGATPGNTSSALIQTIGIRNNGRRGALIEFRGSSLGARSVKRARRKRSNEKYDAQTGAKLKAEFAIRRDDKGRAVYSKKARKARNQDKAGIVFRHLRIALLQLSGRERDAVLQGFVAVSSGIVDNSLGFKIRPTERGHTLAVDVARRLRA